MDLVLEMYGWGHDIPQAPPAPPPEPPPGALQCVRCGYEWVSRVPNPVYCPKCAKRWNHTLLTAEERSELMRGVWERRQAVDRGAGVLLTAQPNIPLCPKGAGPGVHPDMCGCAEEERAVQVEDAATP